MAELVRIPNSFVELVIAYSRPDIRAFNDRAIMVQSVFDALSAWSPKLDDIEPLSTGKLSEQGFNFKLPLKQVSFFFGPASCRFTRDNADLSSPVENSPLCRSKIPQPRRGGGLQNRLGGAT